MSVPRGFGLNGRGYYTNVCKPEGVWLNFVVDRVNTNGLGVRSVKSNGYVEAVFMNTTQTPGVSGTLTNPNPVVGFAVVRFKNNFNYFLGTFESLVAPLSASALTSVTKGVVYVITALGTTTLAQWLAAGVPQGITPAIGVAFIASVTASIGGTGTVGTVGVPTTQAVTVVGDPNTTLNNSNISANAGAQVILQFNAATAAGNTALIPAAPADGTVVELYFEFDGSSVTIDGL